MALFEIIVGAAGFPAPESTEYINAALKGVKGVPERPGYGKLKSIDFENLPEGGFRLLNGLKFGAGEVWYFVPTAYQHEVVLDDYSNGFHFAKVLSSLFGRVGWRQTTLPELTGLSVATTTSRSGRYFQDFHAAVQVQLINDCQEDMNLGEFAFNELLASLQTSAISRLVNAVFSDPALIEQGRVFERHYKQHRVIENRERFVGVQIKLAPDNIAMQLNQILLSFTQNATFNLYLFAEGKKNPLRVQEITVIGGDTTAIDLYWILNEWQHNSRIFYLGYFQDDIGESQAYDVDGFTNCTHTIGANYFNAKVEGVADFDRSNPQFTSTNYGINLEFSAFRDNTKMITGNARMFDEAIGLQVAVMVIEMIQISVRSNRNQRISAEQLKQLFTDLNLSIPTMEAPFSPGLKSRLEKELSRLKKQFHKKLLIITTTPPCFT